MGLPDPKSRPKQHDVAPPSTLVTPTVRTVGNGRMRVSREPNDLLVAYALGSCVGVAAWDSVARVGGLLHAMLPTSKLDAAKARERPAMFVDTGVTALLRAMRAKGALAGRTRVTIAGGGARATGPEHFDIGRRNVLAARRVLWERRLRIVGEAVGGPWPRPLSQPIATGAARVSIREQGGASRDEDLGPSGAGRCSGPRPGAGTSGARGGQDELRHPDRG